MRTRTYDKANIKNPRNLELSRGERKPICPLWLSHLGWLWLLFPLHLPLLSFSLGAESAGFLERILRCSGFLLGNSKFPPLEPPEVWHGSILAFYC